MRNKRLIMFACGAFCVSQSHAETLGVLVAHSGDDSIGKRFVAEVKNHVRSTPTFHIVYSEDEAIYKINIVTMDPNAGEPNAELSTIYSSTMLIDNANGFDYYLTSHVGSCGSDRVKSCSDKLIQDLSVEHEQLVEALVQLSAGE